ERNNRHRWSGAGFPSSSRIRDIAIRTGAWATLSFEEPETSKSALKAKSSFPGVEKEERDAEKCYAPRISCSPFPGESWHLAVRIDDPDPVAVASQGSSSATLHEFQDPLRTA